MVKTMVRRLMVVSVVLLAAFGVTRLTQKPSVIAAAAAPLPDTALTQLLATIRPQAGEDQFDTIPWQTSLWQSRVLAAKLGKPILLWEMDGHPLGCG